MANTWFVCIDPVDKGKPASYLDSVDFRIQVQPSDPNYATLQAGGVINWNGQNLIKWKGPFATEAQAQAAQNPAPSPENPAAPVIQGIGNIPGLAGLTSIGNFFGTLTQASTWERLLLVVLGAGLVIVAAATLFEGTSVGRTATKIAGKAAIL